MLQVNKNLEKKKRKQGTRFVLRDTSNIYLVTAMPMATEVGSTLLELMDVEKT